MHEQIVAVLQQSSVVFKGLTVTFNNLFIIINYLFSTLKLSLCAWRNQVSILTWSILILHAVAMMFISWMWISNNSTAKLQHIWNNIEINSHYMFMVWNCRSRTTNLTPWICIWFETQVKALKSTQEIPGLIYVL